MSDIWFMVVVASVLLLIYVLAEYISDYLKKHFKRFVK